MSAGRERAEAGLTLVEVGIVIVVFTAVVSAIFALFSAQLRSSQTTKAVLIVSRQNQQALQRMAEELLGTDVDLVNVTFGTPGGTRTFAPMRPDGATFTVTVYDSITFRRIVGFDELAGQQKWSTPITFRRHAATGRVERVQDGQVRVLATRATSLGFYNALGRIGITLRTEDSRTDVSVTNRIEVVPRNAGEG
jgi:hypothetical protein